LRTAFSPNETPHVTGTLNAHCIDSSDGTSFTFLHSLGQLLPLNDSGKQSSTRLLPPGTCRKTNSHNSAKTAIRSLAPIGRQYVGQSQPLNTTTRWQFVDQISNPANQSATSTTYGLPEICRLLHLPMSNLFLNDFEGIGVHKFFSPKCKKLPASPTNG
jgi:hypothetical protein